MAQDDPRDLRLPHDAVTLVIACAFVSVHLLVLLQRFSRADWRSIRGRILRRIREVFSTVPANDLVKGRVQQEMCARRTARARNVMMILSVVAPVYLLSLVAEFASEGERRNNQSQDILRLCQVGMITLLVAVPRLLNSKTLDAWYFVLIGTVCAHWGVSALATQDIYMLMAPALMMQLVLALFNLKMVSVVVGTACYFASVLYTYNMHAEAQLSAGGPTCIGPKQGVAAAGTGCLLLLSAVAAMEHGLRFAVRREVEKEGDQNMLAAIRAVLNTICEVVVELDSELRLSDHTPQLVDVLLLSPLHSLQGTPLSDYISSAGDREQFEGRMRTGRVGSSIADAFHTRLQDSAGSAVCMEVFSVALSGLDRRPHYVLGMREFTDVPPVMRRDVQQQPHRRWGSQHTHEVLQQGAPAQAPQQGTPAQPDRLGLPSSAPSRGSTADAESQSSGPARAGPEL
mmetsp:Transcript_10480/g.29528  ORF Transcript_10480/g.29528 Transcript_10480/m.29528 type:complete len:457 (-) Transcript_10480:1404-2774(-)